MHSGWTPGPPGRAAAGDVKHCIRPVTVLAPSAAAAGLPPPDGLDMWPLISGANATSPRTLVFLGDSSDSQNIGNTTVQVGALL